MPMLAKRAGYCSCEAWMGVQTALFRGGKEAGLQSFSLGLEEFLKELNSILHLQFLNN
jgi:hypothetical protein